MVDDQGGSDRRPRAGPDHSLIGSLETAALREQAIGVLAWYHQIEPSEAAVLLSVLAEHLDCSVDDFATQVLRNAAARRGSPDEPPRPGEAAQDAGDHVADESGTSK